MRTIRAQLATGDYRNTPLLLRERIKENERYPGGPERAPHVPSETKIAACQSSINSLRRLMREAELVPDPKARQGLLDAIYRLIDYNLECIFHERDPNNWQLRGSAAKWESQKCLVEEAILSLLPAKAAGPGEKPVRVFELYSSGPKEEKQLEPAA